MLGMTFGEQMVLKFVLPQVIHGIMDGIVSGARLKASSIRLDTCGCRGN